MDERKKKELKAILFIIIVYSIAHFLIILSRGFWSDGSHLITLIHDGAYDKLWVHLGPFRSYALYYLIQGLLLLDGNITILIKIIGFLNWLAAGTALYFLSRNVIGLVRRDSVFIATCFVLFPSFPFKGELAYLHFSMAVAVFFIAALVYFWAEKRINILARWTGYGLASVLFLFSFTTNSILVFYGGFLLVLLVRWHKNKAGPIFRWLLSWCKRNAFFILLPIAYWIFQLSLGKPYGELGNHYNKLLFFEPGFLRTAFDNVWNFVAYGFFWQFVAPASILERRIFAAVFIAVFGMLVFLSRICLTENRDSADGGFSLKPNHYFWCGIVWFILGIFPYIAVGDYPTIYGDGFHMRYAILVPLGASLIILSAILAFVREKWQSVTQYAFLAAFVTFNIYNYYTLDMDWYRQKAIVANLRGATSQEILKASTLIFHDNDQELKYMGRNIKTAEYTLYLHQALFPKSFKFGFAIGDIGSGQTVSDAILNNYGRFNRIGEWPHPANFNPLAKTVEVRVISTAERETMTVGEWLTLKKAELFSDESAFAKKLEDELKIEVVPIVPEKIVTQTP